jgi:hypothetical protein
MAVLGASALAQGAQGQQSLTDDVLQIQVKYVPLQDRVLAQVRTRDERVHSIWYTRRMLSRFVPNYLILAARSARSDQVNVSPTEVGGDADMQNETALKPDSSADVEPSCLNGSLDPNTPMLPSTVDLSFPGGKFINLVFVDACNRRLQLQLHLEVGARFLTLMVDAAVVGKWAEPFMARTSPAGVDRSQERTPK